jgi:hypothetical protein
MCCLELVSALGGGGGGTLCIKRSYGDLEIRFLEKGGGPGGSGKRCNGLLLWRFGFNLGWRLGLG